MTQEEKQLLLKDLCARLPYGVKCKIEKDWFYDEIKPYDSILNPIILERLLSQQDTDYCVKPYLRPMSSMTDEEKVEYTSYCFEQPFLQKGKTPNLGSVPMCIDWLNQHHFDYRGLIEKGLALEAPESMYSIKSK